MSHLHSSGLWRQLTPTPETASGTKWKYWLLFDQSIGVEGNELGSILVQMQKMNAKHTSDDAFDGWSNKERPQDGQVATHAPNQLNTTIFIKHCVENTRHSVIIILGAWGLWMTREEACGEHPVDDPGPKGALLSSFRGMEALWEVFGSVDGACGEWGEIWLENDVACFIEGWHGSPMNALLFQHVFSSSMYEECRAPARCRYSRRNSWCPSAG